MPSQLQSIEHNIKALKSISLTALDIEDRVEYFLALIEVLKEKMYFYIKNGAYRSSMDIESEVSVHQKYVDWLTTLVNNYKPVLEKNNKYLRFSRGEFDLAAYVDAKSMLATIFFGSGVTIETVGNMFILTPTIPHINLDNEIAAMQKFCKDEGFVVIKDKKRRNQYKLKEGQILIDTPVKKIDEIEI